MTSMNTGPRGSRPAADNDVYTVLMLISAVFALVATVYLIVRSANMFGGVLPAAGG
ncbi:MAG: hypothetical protein IPM64_04190 [Phycisphaerales bacterium]|nr:hypothetical protein [Phycisphaerales bacterium]